jgi:cephalosporin hydroxylase
MNSIIGHTSYKGYTAQQHGDAFDVFKEFLKEIKPSQILEIGTAGGVFTLFLREALNEIGLESTKIKSFDVLPCNWYDTIRENNVEIIVENIFDHSYMNLEKPEKVVPFIQQDGVTLVLCDGGFKIGEFRMLSPYLKVGDYIMAHDYVDTIENFESNFRDKIWNWCEIKDSDISEACEKNNLTPYNKENFDKVVWVCRKKEF